MNLSDIAIRKHVFTWMLMAALILFGGLCFREMGVSELPDVDFPLVNVRVNLEGAAPEIMEIQVVDPIESAVMSVEGIKSISSSARQGSANVTVEFELSKDIDVAVQEIQTRIAQAQRKLPEEIEPPIVTKQNPEDRPILWLSVRSTSLSTRELMEFVRDRLRDRFSTLPGVADVNLGGYLEPNLRVWVSSEKLRQYALTVDDVMGTIQREHNELPAGRIETPEKEIGVRMLGEASTVEEFGRLLIQTRGGAPSWRPILLSEVADIEDSLEDVRRRSRTVGEPSVGIGIIKQRGANAVAVAEAAKRRLAELESELPPSVQIAVSFDATTFIEEAVQELLFTLLLAAILTAIVCWAFLGSWSATFNIILAIPTSIVGSFIVLKLLNFTLNTFTLLGLSLAIGIVVDDAIMVLENIVRHLEMKKGRVQAAMIGTREIAFAALAATLAIVAIFLPVAFMKGLIGRYFFQFGVTISVAVMLSLLEALTLTPMRCSRFLDTGRHTRLGRLMDAAFHGMEALYARTLRAALDRPVLVVVAAVAVFVSSLFIVRLLKQEFVPSQDQGRLMVRLKTPEGSSLDFTDGKVKEAERILSTWPEVETYFVAVGGFGGGEVNTAVAFVTLKPKGRRGVDPALQREPTQSDVARKIRSALGKIAGVKAYVQDMSQSGLGGRRGFPLEFVVQGHNWGDLVKGSETMIAELEKSGLATDVHSDYVAGVPELKVEPDRERAARFGVSVGHIGETLNALVGGVVAGMYTKDGKRYDIRVRLKDGERNRVEDLKRLSVRNNRGELVALSELVRLREGEGPQTITRLNRARSITVAANITAGASQAAAIAKVRELARTALPQGCFVSLSGSAETFEESFQSLWFALGLGVVVAYMILASQFNSFLHPITVLVALPFSVSGAFVALWLGDQSLNVYSMIGLILLMGIVKKNSILLVDFTNQAREGGDAVRAALEKACPRRLRPILMTSVSTVAAAVPSALNFGPGAETRIPMALTVIGGVLVSTLLTLYVVPAVYQLMPGKLGSESERDIDRQVASDRPAKQRAV